MFRSAAISVCMCIKHLKKQGSAPGRESWDSPCIGGQAGRDCREVAGKPEAREAQEPPRNGCRSPVPTVRLGEMRSHPCLSSQPCAPTVLHVPLGGAAGTTMSPCKHEPQVPSLQVVPEMSSLMGRAWRRDHGLMAMCNGGIRGVPRLGSGVTGLQGAMTVPCPGQGARGAQLGAEGRVHVLGASWGHKPGCTSGTQRGLRRSRCQEPPPEGGLGTA